MPSEHPIRVLAVDSDTESRLSLRRFFAGIPDLVLAADAANLADALKILGEARVDVALLGLDAQGTDGIDMTRQIRQYDPAVRVIIFTASDSADDIFCAMDAGADGYVLKGNFTKALEMAIRSVKLGPVWLDPGIARQVLQITQTASARGPARTLPTGLITLPLLPEEKSTLKELAESNCVDGVCLVDPAFLKKLRRFAPASSHSQ